MTTQKFNAISTNGLNIISVNAETTKEAQALIEVELSKPGREYVKRDWIANDREVRLVLQEPQPQEAPTKETTITIRVREDVKAELKEAAARHDRSLTELLIDGAIKEALILDGKATYKTQAEQYQFDYIMGTAASVFAHVGNKPEQSTRTGAASRLGYYMAQIGEDMKAAFGEDSAEYREAQKLLVLWFGLAIEGNTGSAEDLRKADLATISKKLNP